MHEQRLNAASGGGACSRHRSNRRARKARCEEAAAPQRRRASETESKLFHALAEGPLTMTPAQRQLAPESSTAEVAQHLATEYQRLREEVDALHRQVESQRDL